VTTGPAAIEVLGAEPPPDLIIPDTALAEGEKGAAFMPPPIKHRAGAPLHRGLARPHEMSHRRRDAGKRPRVSALAREFNVARETIHRDQRDLIARGPLDPAVCPECNAPRPGGEMTSASLLSLLSPESRSKKQNIPPRKGPRDGRVAERGAKVSFHRLRQPQGIPAAPPGESVRRKYGTCLSPRHCAILPPFRHQPLFC
jgi:hypothetical protein